MDFLARLRTGKLKEEFPYDRTNIFSQKSTIVSRFIEANKNGELPRPFEELFMLFNSNEGTSFRHAYNHIQARIKQDKISELIAELHKATGDGDETLEQKILNKLSGASNAFRT